MKQQRYFLVVLLAIVFSFSSLNACYNDWKMEEIAAKEKSSNAFPVPIGHALNLDGVGPFKLDRMGALKSKFESGDLGGSIDYSLALIYDKQYEKGEKVCREIAQKWPDLYQPAANLGTILEVNGKNQEALKWIKRSLKINPNSHGGSEWVHVKILEAKLNPQKRWTGARMTGFDFGQDSIPNSKKDSTALKKLQMDLYLQLNERVTFIQPKDTFIAVLMFELGNATFELGEKRHAKKIYLSAQKYGFADPLLMARLAAVSPKTVAADTIGQSLDTGAIRESPAFPKSSETEAPKNKYTLLLISLLAIAGAIGSFLYGKRMMKKR